MPRNKTLWAFGSWYGSRFSDNPKYFFIYCNSANTSPIKAVWISERRDVVQRIRELGYPAFTRFSIKGLWYAMRAGVYVFDCRVADVNPVTANGAITVNLWHGVPLKKIEQDIEQPNHPIRQARSGPLLRRIAWKLVRPDFTEHYDFMLATSPWTATRLGGAFGLRQDQMIVAGYPRNDVLLSAKAIERSLTAEERAYADAFRKHAREGRRVVLYMPTFRDWNNSSQRTIPIDWSDMNHTLAENGGVLYCKLHPVDRAAVPTVQALPWVEFIPSTVDIYPLLRHTDALITDYSSVYFDYLLLDKPVLFYPYDLQEYQSKSRSLYDPYAEVTPGPKAYTEAELTHWLCKILSQYDQVERNWRGERAALRARAFGHSDDLASSRLMSAILERVTATRSPTSQESTVRSHMSNSRDN